MEGQCQRGAETALLQSDLEKVEEFKKSLGKIAFERGTVVFNRCRWGPVAVRHLQSQSLGFVKHVSQKRLISGSSEKC